jgi:hypothetical protein
MQGVRDSRTRQAGGQSFKVEFAAIVLLAADGFLGSPICSLHSHTADRSADSQSVASSAGGIPVAARLRGTRHWHDSPRVPRPRHRSQRGFTIPARFLAYYHESRTHLSFAKDPPALRPVQPPELGAVVAIDTKVSRL